MPKANSYRIAAYAIGLIIVILSFIDTKDEGLGIVKLLTYSGLLIVIILMNKARPNWYLFAALIAYTLCWNLLLVISPMTGIHDETTNLGLIIIASKVLMVLSIALFIIGVFAKIQNEKAIFGKQLNTGLIALIILGITGILQLAIRI